MPSRYYASWLRVTRRTYMADWGKLSKMPCTKCRHFANCRYFRDAYSVAYYCFPFERAEIDQDKEIFQRWLNSQTVTVEPEGAPSVSYDVIVGIKGTMPHQQYQMYRRIEAFDCKQYIEDNETVENTLLRFVNEKKQEKP